MLNILKIVALSGSLIPDLILWSTYSRGVPPFEEVYHDLSVIGEGIFNSLICYLKSKNFK